MVSFDDDPTAGSGDDSQDEDDNMEDVEEADQDGEMEGDGEGEGDEDNEGENEEDNETDDEQDEPDSPTQARQHGNLDGRRNAPTVLLTEPSPRPSSRGADAAYWPQMRPEALSARTYDCVPTIAAPQSTSINAVTATPDMRWAFSGGADGYIRMYNWVETANGKVPLTVAQKHPFVDSVMKAGSLTTYWENEETSSRALPRQSGENAKELSPVYSLAAQREALWLLSGLESGGIALQTCRHGAGTRITTLREHTSAVSVLSLSKDEKSLLSGSWDKRILDWDMNIGRVKRSFLGSGGQISAIEMRPLSSNPIPRVSETTQEQRTTFSSNNASKPTLNGAATNGEAVSRRGSRVGENGTENDAGSPGGSLFGDNDTGSLFGDNDDDGNGGGAFGDDDDEFGKAIANGLQQAEDEESNMTNGQSQPNEDAHTNEDNDVSMTDLTQGGPVQLAGDNEVLKTEDMSGVPKATENDDISDVPFGGAGDGPSAALPDGMQDGSTTDEQQPTSESTFLDTSINGTIRIWDRRVAAPIARILPPRNTPPWCMGASWSPDGNFFYAGRRNGTVEEYSIHKGFQMAEPSRTFRFPTGSGAVSAVRSMPNGKHLVCASFDILRLYDLREQENASKSAVPFLIVPGHRTGVISALYIDPTCRYMISAAGNRGWDGHSTEVMLGYEINIPGS